MSRARRCARLVGRLAAALLAPLAAGAQATTAGRPDWCPAFGATIDASATGGSVTDAAGVPTPVRDTVIRLDARTAIDTTATFSLEERRWRWSSIAAWVAAGASGGGSGLAAGAHRSAGRGTDSAPWHACVGAGLTMRDATLLVRRAGGTIRLKVDLSPLARLRSSDSTGAVPRR
jgi:hypothetical protein